MITQVIGFLAAFVGTQVMLPQIIKTIKTKRVDDLSLLMLVVYLLNCSLWLAYGLLISAWPVIICNSIALIISIVQLILKFKYGRKNKLFEEYLS